MSSSGIQTMFTETGTAVVYNLAKSEQSCIDVLPDH